MNAGPLSRDVLNQNPSLSAMEGEEPVLSNDDLVMLKWERHRRNLDIFFKVCFLFLVELVMVIFSIKYFLDWGVDETPDYGTIALKYGCIMASHLLQQPLIWRSIKRLRFVMKHRHLFESNFFPQLICWLKLFSEISIEICMVVASAFENWNVFTIMDFNALMIINFLDVYYAMTIKTHLMDRVKAINMSLPKTNKKMPYNKFANWEKVAYWALEWLIKLYKTVYYHFLPYIGMVVSYILVDQTAWEPY